MILIGYDGSDDAKAAIAQVGSLCPGATTSVLTIWEPFASMLARTPAGLIGDVAKFDAAAKHGAEQASQEGVELARAAGLEASAVTAAGTGAIADAILDAAEQLDADAIALGSRGLTGVGSMLGSVSHLVVQHADRTVIVVPAPSVIAHRSSHHRHALEHAVR